MLIKKLVTAAIVGIIATTSLPVVAADMNTWTSIMSFANKEQMKGDMKMMKEAMEMMRVAEEKKDMAMAKKAIEMMKKYTNDYERIFSGNGG
jgi:hypothetical protein